MFLSASQKASREVRTFCLVLAYTGCRISEALALTADRVDLTANTISEIPQVALPGCPRP